MTALAPTPASEGEPTRVTLVSAAEIIGVRFFPVGVERVYAAFVVPRLLAHWWGPLGWRSSVERLDVSAGGRWRVRLEGPGGEVHVREGEFLEVVPNVRLVRTLRFSEFPEISAVETVEFEPSAGGTRLTVRTRFLSGAGPNSLTAAGIENGVRSLFDRLARLLNSVSEGG